MTTVPLSGLNDYNDIKRVENYKNCQGYGEISKSSSGNNHKKENGKGGEDLECQKIGINSVQSGRDFNRNEQQKESIYSRSSLHYFNS